MTKAKRGQILLIDGHSLAYRAFFALPVENFSTTTGQPTNAVYGFTSMLLNALRSEDPTHIAVAFDVSRVTFRTEQFPEYKGTRSASPEGFKGQVELITEVLNALGIPSFSMDGFEADDIIATLATECVADGLDVLILTGDRDTFQLVNEATTVLYPMRGVSELARMTPAAIVEKYGLTPAQYPDFAALRGDPSDNLPGIPGVGEKTAAKWITTYGDLANLIAHAPEITGKVGDALRNNLESVLLNRTLIELVKTVPLNTSVSALERVRVPRGQVDQLFDSLQFRALRDRLDVVLTQEDDEVQPNTTVSARTEVPVETLLKQRPPAAPLALWFTGSWGAGTGTITSVGAACRVGDDSVLMAAGELSEFESALGDATMLKIGHDIKGPMLALNTPIAKVWRDTALGAYLCNPGSRSYALDVLVPSLAEQTASGETLFDLDDGATALRAATVLELSETQEAQLADRGLIELLERIELPVSVCLAQMEKEGIAVDVQHFRSLSDRFAKQAQAATEDAHREAGREFNLGSPKQLQEVLFEERQLPKTKKIKTGYTTDAEALNGIYAATGDRVVEAVLRWRDVTKLKQTVDGLIPLASRDGRIHTTFTQTVAATGRLSSLEPNLQNIPVRSVAGREIREGFVASNTAEGLLTADYSQIEMRIMAHLSQDDALIAAFAAGEDLHTSTASMVFGVDASEVDAELRRRIKAVSYGLAYGLSAYGLAQSLGITQSEASYLMSAYFERFGGVRDYLEAAVRTASACGYTETMFGRRRYLPDLTSTNRQRREMAERMALNAPIQGTAADIMKIAMLNVANAIADRKMSSRLLLQVHDELVLDVAAGEREALTELVCEQMGAAAQLQVALDVEVGFGANWAEAAH